MKVLRHVIKDHKAGSPKIEHINPADLWLKGTVDSTCICLKLLAKFLESIKKESGEFEINSTGHLLHKIV